MINVCGSCLRVFVRLFDSQYHHRQVGVINLPTQRRRFTSTSKTCVLVCLQRVGNKRHHDDDILSSNQPARQSVATAIISALANKRCVAGEASHGRNKRMQCSLSPNTQEYFALSVERTKSCYYLVAPMRMMVPVVSFTKNIGVVYNCNMIKKR